MNSEKEKQVRKCIVTNQHFNKADMIRIVSFQGADIQIDLSGKKPGRGCYVSMKSENLEKLIEKNGAILARTFKKKISKEEIEYLKAEFPKALEEKSFRPKATKPVIVRVNKDKLKEIKNS